jgi:hypothetical protein
MISAFEDDPQILMYLIILNYLLKKSPKMTLWVSQSASNSHQNPKMSVDSESTL